MSPRRSESRKPPARDMDASPFAIILADLVARLPGAYAAALVDWEGETVDYTGHVDPFDVKVAAAELGLVLVTLKGQATLGDPSWIVVRGRARSLLVHAMPEGYAITVLLRRRAGFTASRRAFAVTQQALAKEADWPLTEAPWFPVEVRSERGRPVRVTHKGEAHGVDVLGTVMGLQPRERGFRVRTDTGNEITLVREAGDWWYADDPPAGRGPVSRR
ncbi:MAG: hypothetical protein JNL38_37830 [Myxococcales bacterium]|nr:hypothetical protein [Myxococcales bacterium]